ncbi:MAG: acyl carrier protein [Desulfobacteraceae bacterium]|nr:acyl carrier protein [Desulfobacteraceae bacterium]MBC2718997.1 acyl carrier protein [Desulfobacteraceae bacterium]
MSSVTHDEVVSVIKKTDVKLDWERIDLKENLTEQGADSLDMINIIFALQEKYGVEITDESISDGEWLSIDKMVSNLNRALQQK